MVGSPRPRSPKVGSNGVVPTINGPGRRKSGLRARSTQLLAIRFGWVVLVIWYEVGEFFHSLSTCKFPDSALRRSSTPPTHVVLLADPHVLHPRLSYHPDSRAWVNFLRQAMDELFMRKSWNVVMRLGRVDNVIVIGDMLDWGRGVMSDAEYDEYFSLYESIFRLPPGLPTYYVPGNHDLSLGPSGMGRLFSPYARDRYKSHFSDINMVVPIANHSFILLDAVGLVEEDYRRYASEMQFGEWDGVEGGVIEFVKNLEDVPPPGPTILISHIPLARPEASTCGPLRERGRILKGAGPGYQNLLGSETSRFILSVIKPSVIFSGDDHDYCEHTHPGGIKEVTVKSFSSSTGIRRPGFQLLSLIPPDPTSASRQITHADRPCILPDQLGVYYRVYMPLAIITVLFLLGSNIRAAYKRWTASGRSIYGDLKQRLSPSASHVDVMPNPPAFSSRRHSDRPVPLTLPSRRSTQALTGMTTLSPATASYPRSATRAPSYSYGLSSGVVDNSPFALSAPGSPGGSPRASYEERDRDDVEAGDPYAEATPSTSRRSSYIYMSRSASAAPGSQMNEPFSYENGVNPYLLPLSATGNPGLGFSSPTSASSWGQTLPIRRVSSNASITSSTSHVNVPSTAHPLSQAHSPYPPGLHPNGPQRRTTMPRVLSATDWSSTSRSRDPREKDREKSSGAGGFQFGYPESLSLALASSGLGSLGPGSGLGAGGGGRSSHKTWLAFILGFARMLWKARNGVIGKSWREMVAVAWPVGVVWVLVNALFFLQ